jgi:hypothetical protein
VFPVSPCLHRNLFVRGIVQRDTLRYPDLVRLPLSKPVVCVGIVILGYFGCTRLTWTTVYTSQSPDGKYGISVDDFLHIGPDNPVRIRLRRGLWSKTLASKSDCWFSFAHAIWRGPIVGVVVEGRVCGQIQTAYNVRDGVAVPFAAIEAEMRRSIINEYAVTDAELAAVHGDALLWIAHDQFNNFRAAEAFERRYGRKH